MGKSLPNETRSPQTPSGGYARLTDVVGAKEATRLIQANRDRQRKLSALRLIGRRAG
jgi:hypothetical protein